MVVFLIVIVCFFIALFVAALVVRAQSKSSSISNIDVERDMSVYYRSKPSSVPADKPNFDYVSKKNANPFIEDTRFNDIRLDNGLVSNAKSYPIKKIPREYVSFDIETTGLNPNTDRIIEYGAVKYKDGKEIDSFSCFVNPQCHIPEEATRVNHITDDMVKNASGYVMALYEFLDFCQNSTLVGHNIDEFDIPFIKEEAKRAARSVLTDKGKALFDIKNSSFDTLSFTGKVFYKRMKLTVLSNYLNINQNNAHRALDDARTAALCLEEVYKRLLTITEDPFGFLPKAQGVLKDEVLCFSGEHPVYSKHEIMKKASDMGASLSKTTTLKTTKVIVINDGAKEDIDKAKRYKKRTGVILQSFDDWAKEVNFAKY